MEKKDKIMVLDIKVYPDSVLTQQAQSIEDITEEENNLANNMVETMYVQKGIGLAAPQVGVSQSLITVDVSGPEEQKDLKILFNPVIVNKEGQVDSDEACLSLPGYKGKVKRAKKVTVQGVDIKGNEIKLDAEGLLAICLQHEIDHLFGVLLLDYAGHLKRSMYEKKVKKWQRKG